MSDACVSQLQTGGARKRRTQTVSTKLMSEEEGELQPEFAGIRMRNGLVFHQGNGARSEPGKRTSGNDVHLAARELYNKASTFRYLVGDQKGWQHR